MISAARPRRAMPAPFALAVVALALAVASPAQALNIGYYEMCEGQGSALQPPPITATGHTAVNLLDLTAGDLAGVDVIFVNNCDNFAYGAEYLSRLADIDAAVAAGKVLMIHDRYVEDGELILPGGASFDVVRETSLGSKQIEVVDDSTVLTSGPAGMITDTNLDGGCESNHGFTVAGSLPGDARIILSRDTPTDIVTFAYGYGAGAVIYSSVPLDFYLGSPSCGPAANFKNIYAPNVIAYSATLAESACGNGAVGAGETCDLGAGNNGETCCRFDCTLRPAGATCRESAGACDPAELCDGSTTICPADDIEPAGTVCRAAADLCDVAEECDGANDACPADALAPAGTICRAAADDCDVAEVCDGSTIACPGDAVLPDGDGDTVCDAVDNCDATPNPGQQDDDSDDQGNACDACTDIATTPVKQTGIAISKLHTPPGDDTLTINMTLEGVPASPAVDPLANGVRVILDNLDAPATMLDAAIPGGAYSKVTKLGWRVNRSGTSFTYKNASLTPISGIVSVNVKRLATGRTKVTVRGKKSSYVVPPSDDSLKATVVLDPPTAETGQCGEASFLACTRNRPGSRLTCK